MLSDSANGMGGGCTLLPPAAAHRRLAPPTLSVVAIIAATLSLVVLVSFIVIVWVLWSKQRCSCVVWPWQRNRREETGGPAAASGSQAGANSGAAGRR